MEEDLLGIINSNLDIGNAGVGYVVIPEEDDRDFYIESCYKTNRITIQGGRGYGFFNNVACPPNVIQELVFPEFGDFGTPVIWVKDGVSGLPIVIGYLNKEGDGYSVSGNQYRIVRGNNGTKTVELTIDGEDCALEINLLGDAENPSKFSIKVNSENEDSEIDLYCDNSIKLSAEKEVKIQTNNSFSILVKDGSAVKSSLSFALGKGLNYVDEFSNEINIVKNEMQFKSKVIKNGEGTQPAVLGDSLKDILEELINTITSMVMTVTMPTAVVSPPTVMKLTTIKGKLSSVLSELSKTD